MKWTPKQREILSIKDLCDVVYSNMWQSKGSLGYSFKGFRHYGVRVAKDLPSEARAAVLIHEVAHAYLGHLDRVDQKKEIQDIKKIFDELDIPFARILLYGGPMSFLNICMDLEINTSILTLKNVQDLCKIAQICTPDLYGIPVLDSFRDYYRPMIERLKNISSDPPNKKGIPVPGSKGSEPFKLPNSEKDLADKLSPLFDDELDSEIRDALSEEDYVSGNEKEQNQDLDREEEIYTPAEAADMEEDGGDIKGYGKSHGIAGFHVEEDSPEKIIQKFLSTIVKHDLQYSQDAIRHYNRNTRNNSEGFLYTSRKRKNATAPQRLAILVDVSGSMDTSQVLKAIGTFKNSSSLIAGGSKLITWDTKKVDEYLISEIPKTVDLGDGTDIGRGLRYVANQGFEDIVIYSDFETPLETLISAAKSCKANIYSICTKDKSKETAKEFFVLNKKVLWI